MIARPDWLGYYLFMKTNAALLVLAILTTACATDERPVHYVSLPHSNSTDLIAAALKKPAEVLASSADSELPVTLFEAAPKLPKAPKGDEADEPCELKVDWACTGVTVFACDEITGWHFVVDGEGSTSFKQKGFNNSSITKAFNGIPKSFTVDTKKTHHDIEIPNMECAMAGIIPTIHCSQGGPRTEVNFFGPGVTATSCDGIEHVKITLDNGSTVESDHDDLLSGTFMGMAFTTPSGISGALPGDAFDSLLDPSSAVVDHDSIVSVEIDGAVFWR